MEGPDTQSLDAGVKIHGVNAVSHDRSLGGCVVNDRGGHLVLKQLEWSDHIVGISQFLVPFLGKVDQCVDLSVQIADHGLNSND